MQVGVKSSPDSFSAIAFILSKYRIVSSEFEEIMKLIDKEIKKTIPPIVSIISLLSILYALNGRKVTVWILFRYERVRI